MPRGMSLHIGLNHVDPEAYAGWAGQLAACVQDATDMKAITDVIGYDTALLLDDDATAEAVTDRIREMARELSDGDHCVITYSGHGSQLPDDGSDPDDPEPDNMDETWVLWNRELLDDELGQLWSEFARGVRILLLSDSCHSGTVARMVFYAGVAQSKEISRSYEHHSAPPRSKAKTKEVDGDGVDPATRAGEGWLRVMPATVQQRVIEKGPVDYAKVRATVDHPFRLSRGRAAADRGSGIDATVILISGCQDNQLSADGTRNGLFTSKVLEVWDGGQFVGDHRQFHAEIVDLMPGTQTPNYETVGADDPDFEAQGPFEINGPMSVAATPSVSGPDQLDASDPAPTFEVDLHSGEWAELEIATDPAYLDIDATARETDPDNFYATWQDADGRFDSTWYTLPDDVWSRLGHADTLWYRVGIVDGPSGWNPWTLSTAEGDGASAPSMTVTHSG